MDIRAGLTRHRFRVSPHKRSRLAALVAVMAAGFLTSTVYADPATGVVRGKVSVMKKVLFGGTKKSDDAGGVIVYVTGYAEPAPETTVTLDQKDKAFNPRLLPVVMGQTVSFPNRDRFYHNVFSVSPLQAFDLGQYKSTETPRTQRFDKPGLIPVYCNIHPQMLSYVVVLENRAFAITDADGSFELRGVRAGPIAVNAWAPGAKRVTQQLELAPGADVTVALEIARTQPIPPHQRKDGTAYPPQTSNIGYDE